MVTLIKAIKCSRLNRQSRSPKEVFVLFSDFKPESIMGCNEYIEKDCSCMLKKINSEESLPKYDACLFSKWHNFHQEQKIYD